MNANPCRVPIKPLFALAGDSISATDTAPVTRQNAPAPGLPPVDFIHPPRDNETRHIHDWTVLLEKHLMDTTSDLAERALQWLDQKLGEVLPRLSHLHLMKLMLFLNAGRISEIQQTTGRMSCRDRPPLQT